MLTYGSYNKCVNVSVSVYFYMSEYIHMITSHARTSQIGRSLAISMIRHDFSIKVGVVWGPTLSTLIVIVLHLITNAKHLLMCILVS